MNREIEAELKRQEAEALNDERKLFIREAAIALASVADTGPAAHDQCGHTCLLAKCDEAGALARGLWDTKPEDC